MSDANNDPILEGDLADFNLVEVLQVLSLSRQYTRVEVFFDERMLAGSIFIKSGKVVQASSGALRGKKAFLNLLRRHPKRFRVFRINTPALIPEPVGSLSHLLFEAIEMEVQSAPSARRSFPAPPTAKMSQPQARTMAPPPPEPPPLGRAAAVRQRSHSGVHTSRSAPGPCVIGIASPKGGSGKTTVSLNLALSLARRGLKVILVDGDVNGDVMSSLDERKNAKAGVFDVLTGAAAPLDALRKTVVQDLEILPALGQSMPSPEVAFVDYRDRWQALFNELTHRADVVIVDTPAGMFGMTYQILSAVTHVIGVLQAEVIAQRSFTMFEDSLALLPDNGRPKVLGVFLNMLQLQHNASIDVLSRACESLPKEWLFETSIPRNDAFLEANAMSVPLHMLDPKHPPAVSWLFDTLATEVLDRLSLSPREALAPQRRFLA